MHNALNILSIDFDFFQNTTADIMSRCYPDGIDLPTSISRIVWSSYYATPTTLKDLNSVTIDQKNLDTLSVKLTGCKTDIPVMITNSHVKIYDFIHGLMLKNNLLKLNVTNIDMHNDMINNNYELDCGNWLKFISDDYDTSITWIAKPASFEMYGLDKTAFNMIKTDLTDIDPQTIDAIFLCRSDAWLPPHLDIHFDQLKAFISKRFSDVSIEADVASPRNITKLAEQISPLYSKAAKSNNERE